MYPILFEWGSFVLPAWHFFYFLAAVVAFVYVKHFGIDADLEPRFVANLYLVGYVGGYFGARGLSVFIDESPQGVFDYLQRLFSLGAMTFYGGAIGCFVACLFYIRRSKKPFGTVSDVFFPAGMLALAIGRVGCFLNGDDYGRVVALDPGEAIPWWAVTFPNLHDNFPRYPVQIVSTVFCSICVLILSLKRSQLVKKFGPGVVGLLTVGIYANYRFFIEFYRGDERGSALGLSTSQLISILVLLSLSFYFVFSSKKKKPTQGQ